MVAASKLDIDTGASAMQMAEAIFGDSVQVLNASYSGSGYSSGIYTGGDSTSPGVVPGDEGVILSTGRAGRFTNRGGDANHRSNTSNNTGGENNNADFNALAGTNTYDASYMDISFIPDGDVMTMQFVFSSEEYPEYANSIYNDVVGVWVNGQLVPLEVGNGQTGVTNVNDTDNSNLYVDNTQDQYNTEMDGFTLTMTLTIPVNAGQQNDIRIGIADTSDHRYDSNLLIAGDSIQTDLVAITDDVEMFEGSTKTVDLLANDLNDTGGAMTITHINGVAVGAGDSVTLGTGQVVTLNADGTIDITTDLDHDTINFTYEIETTTGETDVGFVEVTTIPCFVAGTLIAVPSGEMQVEYLRPGDMVLTQDSGPQPLRWIGRRRVQATGPMAPVRIEAGALGNTRTLTVSPLHRILVRDAQAELMFGEPEVLVAAKELVNGGTIRVLEGGVVEYVHLLFDTHQVIWSEGLLTESFLPGTETTKSWEQEIVDEICAIFPELDPKTGAGYSPAARRTLKGYEAQLLAKGLRAA